MRKWWWLWLPGWYKKWKLGAARKDARSSIRGERLHFEAMVQRAQRAGETPDAAFVADVLQRLAEIEQSAINHVQAIEPKDIQAEDIEEFESLEGDADQQGQFRAYICPIAEIEDEGNLTLDLMEEWNVPKSVIDKLRASLGQKLKNATTDPKSARAALRHIFEESDSWSRYTSEYEEEMRRYTGGFFWQLLFCCCWPSSPSTSATVH